MSDSHSPAPGSSHGRRTDPAHAGGGPVRGLLTVVLEDYYHNQPFKHLIERRQWHRLESRLEVNTRRTLDLLDEHGARATFFVLGWVAETLPELVRLVVERGHEVASGGYYHSNIKELGPDRFREDVARSKAVIEHAAGRTVVGFRAAEHWMDRADLWALDVLAEEGYAYDSSIRPFREYAHEPWRRFPHAHHHAGRVIWEFPLPTIDVLGWQIPIAGGNYFRQLPAGLVRRAVEHWHRTKTAPFVMYFRTWELDPTQPRLNAGSVISRVRHYRNLNKFLEIIRYYLEHYRFTSIAEHLAELTNEAPVRELTPEERARRAAVVTASVPVRETGPARRAPGVDERSTGVTLVIPCYNEELTLPYLANTLRSVRRELAPAYAVHFAFVDDGSRDGTWAALQRIFGDWEDCLLLRHERNRGLTAAIRTGLEHAPTEIVCSIDCDCTYDPHDLAQMIPMLTPDCDLVTASPYHRDGAVRNVPGWRLFLSRGASALYRLVARQQLGTYTSCFRVYRRSAALAVPVERDGFLGIAEMLVKLDFAGSRIAEYPTVLHVRILGTSKMQSARAIVGHLRLLASLAWLRLRHGTRPLRDAAAQRQSPVPASRVAPAMGQVTPTGGVGAP